MTNSVKSPENSICTRAEKRLAKAKSQKMPPLSAEEAQTLIHELQVHQAELEIQNEELQKAMTELDASRAKYVGFYDFAPVGYLTLDEKGSILEANLPAAVLLGRERSLLIAKPLELLVHPESLSTFRLFMTKIFSDRNKQSCELKLLRKSDPQIYIYLEGIAAVDAARETEKQCRIVTIDITKRKQIENELESFSYSVSHDLHEPLRAIDGFSRMLLRDLKDKLDEGSKRKFDVIREKTKRMERLINDVTEFSRVGRERSSATVIDLEQLATEVWDEIRKDIPERNISLKIFPLTACYGNKELIRRVIANLLANAVKFTRGRQTATIEVGGSETVDECIYHVKDNGVGFDMRYADKLFQIFRRLHSDEEYEGTGAGLSIVRRIIERHGGRVWAEAKANEGATFYFTLPKNRQEFLNR